MSQGVEKGWEEALLRHRRAQRVNPEIRLSPLQVSLLRAVSSLPEKPQGQLLQEKGLTSPSGSRALKPLFRQGLLRSQVDAKDARQHNLQVTETGLRILRQLDEAVLGATPPRRVPKRRFMEDPGQTYLKIEPMD